MPKYGVRKTGGGGFHLVEINEHGNSRGLYSDGKLMKFDSSEEAKESIREANSLESTKEANPSGNMEELEALPIKPIKPTKKWRAE